MSKFIWVRDRDKRQHFLNVDYIIRVTKVEAQGSYSAYAYLMIAEKDGSGKNKSIELSKEEYDTFEEVVAKIQP